MQNDKSDHSILDVRSDGVAYLTIANGSSLNILSSATIRDLTERLMTLREQGDIRVLVLSGRGEKAFVGGADIKEMASLNASGASAFITRLHALCEAVRQFPVPVIARLSGWSMGAGMELAAACDLRIASESAQFAMPEVKIGIPSVIHAAMFGQLIGEANTRWMLLTGASIDAEKAERWGFVNSVVPRAELDDAVSQLVEQIIECSAAGMRAQKELLTQWVSPHLVQSTRNSIQLIASMFDSNEPQEHMQRFINRKHS